LPQQQSVRTTRRSLTRRPSLVADRVYSETEAALVVGRSRQTLRRARDAGYLQCYGQGRLIAYSGSHLLAWLEAGSKTGRSAADVDRERRTAA
jgi:hypothetical protein